MMVAVSCEGPRREGGQVRRHVWFYNGERGEARTEIDQTSPPAHSSQTELGRKSQEQFVTVASPALPMQNWHLAGSVRTENTRERGELTNSYLSLESWELGNRCRTEDT